ncbi:MAG: hypothetical protein U0231_19750 [Nitrospiraceae bacterium]
MVSALLLSVYSRERAWAFVKTNNGWTLLPQERASPYVRWDRRTFNS